MSAPAPALKPTLDISEKDRAKLVLYATRILRNHEDAEDAVQQALLNAWSRGQYRGECRPITYLTHCVRNQCTMLIRSRRIMIPLPQRVRLSYTPQLDAAIDAQRKLETCFLVLRGRLNYDAIAGLVAVGMEPLEISKSLKIPHSTVRVATLRLRLVLKSSRAVGRR